MSIKAYNRQFGDEPDGQAYRPGDHAICTYEGGLAYRLEPLEAATQLVMLGCIGASYYEDKHKQLEHAKSVWENVIDMAEHDDDAAEYLAKLISYGREKGNMKFQPVLGLVYLSTLSDKTWFRLAFPHVIKTPKDAHDFLELARKANIRKGLGRSLKSELTEYVRGLSTYHVRRYAGKLRDIVRVCHPITVPGTLADQHVTYIMRGDAGDIEELVALKTVRNDLGCGNVDAATLEAIRKYNMQLEELKPLFGTITTQQRCDVFDAMIPGLSIMALIQNLVTIERMYSSNTDECRSDGPDCSYLTPDIIGMVQSRILDVDAYRRSHMLPFTPLIASKVVHVPEWRHALEQLVDMGCAVMFDQDKLAQKRVRINVDTSGSMRGMILAGTCCGPHISLADFVGVMGSALYQAMRDNVSIWAIASGYKRVPVRTLSPVQLGQEIMSTYVGHGTYFEQCMTGNVRRDVYCSRDSNIRYVAEAAYQGEDIYILLTDGEQTDNLEKAWANARKPSEAKLIVWDVGTYARRISERKDVIYLRGYSSQMIDVVCRIIEDGTDQIEQIRQYKLG